MLPISFEELPRIAQYTADAPFAWPILSDPSRETYQAYGLGSASFARTWLSPRTGAFYLRALVRGQRLRWPRADPSQLGGDFVIDPQGFVIFAHRSAEPADRPTVAKLLAVIDGAAHCRLDRRDDTHSDSRPAGPV